jgi:hypothetical protein
VQGKEGKPSWGVGAAFQRTACSNAHGGYGAGTRPTLEGRWQRVDSALARRWQCLTGRLGAKTSHVSWLGFAGATLTRDRPRALNLSASVAGRPRVRYATRTAAPRIAPIVVLATAENRVSTATSNLQVSGRLDHPIRLNRILQNPRTPPPNQRVSRFFTDD